MDIPDLTRRAFRLWNERRFDELLSLFFHEDGVWDITPVGIPDMGAYRGHAAELARKAFDSYVRSERPDPARA